MADDNNRKFEIPWATLLPLIAAVAGVVAQFRPLVSSRPSIPSEKSIDVIAVQDVDARLWQDPIAVAQKSKAQLEADLLTRPVPKSHVERHRLDALVKTVQDGAAVAGERVLLLGVMLDSGPYTEQGESRLRARQAVLEGLNESGFVPADSEHIGFVTIPGVKSDIWTTDAETKPGEKTIEDGATLIPWEECRADLARRIYPEGIKRAYVLWLPASSFNPRPLQSFAELVRPFVQSGSGNMEIKLIGPANSTGLRNMVNELRQPRAESEGNVYEPLDGAEIVSARATASDRALMEGEGDVQQLIQSCVRDPKRGGLRFRRTLKTDDAVLSELIAELKLRRVHVAPRQEGREWVNGERVVILTEWDNPYGRSLASTFEEKAAIAENSSARSSHATRDGKEATPSLSFYRYMHGIDGRLPGDAAKSRDDAPKSASGQTTAVVEATEGLDQSDFLRRLGRRLRDEDTRSWRRDEGGIRAIGLLGSDIFDKLMILRALRPEFPDVIFFTNNFDAHFERQDDWKDVRNLVVASPFGSTLALPETESANFEQRVAPFRDSNQTSMFFGTLVATGRFEDNLLREELERQPRLFEIGRRGSHELHQARFDQERIRLTNNPYWFRDWLFHWRVLWRLALGATALFLMAAWISLSIVDRRLPGGGDAGDRLKRVCSSTAFTLILGVPLIVLAVGLFAQSERAVAEPLAFFSGISIWPTEMLRLVGLLLAVHFMVKAHFDLRANEHEITRRFFPGLTTAHKWHWGLGLRRWQKEHPEWIKDRARLSAKDAWGAYLRRNLFWPRFIRIGALFVMYAAFSGAVISLFPDITTPGRGNAAFRADRLTLVAAGIAMLILTFYVVDAIRLNSNFIRILTRGVTEWDPGISDGSGRIPPLSEAELARYHDIFFVARRTEAIAPLIWYPLIVLAIMCAARSSLFDHWTWPISLVLIFTLNAAWAFGSAIFLRRSAEQLRAAAISNLQWLRVKSYALAEKRQMFDELIAEVRAVKKGAFAPLSEQPFIRAIIYPSGGIGLLAVAQRLLETF